MLGLSCAAHTVYFMLQRLKMPKLGAELEIDLINMEPAK